MAFTLPGREAGGPDIEQERLPLEVVRGECDGVSGTDNTAHVAVRITADGGPVANAIPAELRAGPRLTASGRTLVTRRPSIAV